MDTSTSSIAMQFWVSYTAQILATITVVVVGLVFSYVKVILNRPKMIFHGINAQDAIIVTGRNRFSLNKTSDSNWDASIQLAIRNMGNKTIERFYWEIYAEKDVIVEFACSEPHQNNHTYSRMEGKNSYCYHGFIGMPIFPSEDINFPFELKIRSNVQKRITLNYRFSTDGGSAPWYSPIFLLLNKRTWLSSLIVE